MIRTIFHGKVNSFRQDLFYRIAVFPIHLPPLRERKGDLPLLVEALLARIAPNRKLRLSGEAMARLEGYAFPGNIRELRNLLERAVLLTDGEIIHAEALPAVIAQALPKMPPTAQAQAGIMTLEEAERTYVRWALQQYGGDKKRLAQCLGISERTLYRKLKA